jgi:hypothetical protein
MTAWEDLRCGLTTGECARVYFRFLFAFTDRILRPGGNLVNPSQSRFWSGFGHIAEFVIIRKFPQRGAIV